MLITPSAIYHIVLNKRSCLNIRAANTFKWNILKIGEKLCKMAGKNLYNVPLDALNSPGCLSMRKEHLFGTIRYICCRRGFYFMPQLYPTSCPVEYTSYIPNLYISLKCNICGIIGRSSFIFQSSENSIKFF